MPVEVLAWDRGRGYPESQVSEGIMIRRIRVASRYGSVSDFITSLPLFWLACARIILRRRVRVIHCHDFDTLPVGLLMKVFKRCPVVFDAHEYYPSMVGDMVAAPVRVAIATLHRMMYTMADAVFTPYPSLFHRGRVIDVPNFPLKSGAGTPNRPDRHGNFTVFYYGGLEGDRGVPELLQVVEEAPSSRVIFAGDGPLKRQVESASERNPRVEYLGWIPQTKIEQVLTTADYVAILYRPDHLLHLVAMPNKLFESLKFGAIPIVYDGTAMAKLARAEGFGLIVEPGSGASITEAILRLESNARLKEELRKTGEVAFEEKYNWSTVESRVRENYRRLLSSA
ncbi:MAG: glycosyltransferase [Thaumarchaeota archaeon]|nr:glycosyltransferase [Nitrososphaerota archaeon]